MNMSVNKQSTLCTHFKIILLEHLCFVMINVNKHKVINIENKFLSEKYFVKILLWSYVCTFQNNPRFVMLLSVMIRWVTDMLCYTIYCICMNVRRAEASQKRVKKLKILNRSWPHLKNVSGIQTSLASVIVRYLIFSAERRDRKKEIIFFGGEIFFIFPAELSFLVKRTPEEESGMIHPEGGNGGSIDNKENSGHRHLCKYFGRPNNPLRQILQHFASYNL